MGSKAGSCRNATIFAFDCKTYCCKTYVRHCKENAPIYMYYVAPETPMMSSVIADCLDLVPPNILYKSTPVMSAHSPRGDRYLDEIKGVGYGWTDYKRRVRRGEEAVPPWPAGG